MFRSRDTYEEYIMKQEKEHDKEIVSMAQKIQEYKRDIYKLCLDIEIKDREIERLKSIVEGVEEIAKKYF